VNLPKQRRKLLRIAKKAQECISREQAQKLLKKTRKIFKKLDNYESNRSKKRELDQP